MSIICSRLLISLLVVPLIQFEVLNISSGVCVNAEVEIRLSDTIHSINQNVTTASSTGTTKYPEIKETSVPIILSTTENSPKSITSTKPQPNYTTSNSIFNISTTIDNLNASTTKSFLTTTTIIHPLKNTTTKTPVKNITTSTPLKTSTTNTTTKSPNKTTTKKSQSKTTTTNTPFTNATSKSPQKTTTTKTPFTNTTTQSPNKTTTIKSQLKTSTAKTPFTNATTKSPQRTTTRKSESKTTTTKNPFTTTTAKSPNKTTSTKSQLKTTTTKTPFTNATTKSPNKTTTKNSQSKTPTTKQTTPRVTTSKSDTKTTASTTTPARNQSAPVAKAKTGTYIGYWSVTRAGVQYASFSGIRYVKPMTPFNRFQWAELVDDTNERKEALVEGSDCPQWNIHRRSNKIEGHEDCLFMNIYTPDVKGKYPVMVVIPCGHFVFDSASRYLNGPDYFMNTKEIVMVIFNYRLGPLGYADFRSDKYPSNLGMKDQVLALKWVQRNIAAFGGDPKRVTIQGTSSGAVSVHYHMISPLSKGLFHAGISESGTALDPWSLVYPHRSRDLIISLASKTGCEWAVPVSTVSSADTVAECLRNRSAHQILAATRHVNVNLIQMLFLPVIEVSKHKPFLPEDPYIAPEHRLPWLSGQNSDETGIINSMEKPWYWLLRKYLSSIAYEAIPHWMNYAETATDPWNVTASILYHYGHTFKPPQNIIVPLYKKAGEDGIFWNPHYMSMLKHKATKYSYLFKYRQTTPKGAFLHPDRGVTHSEEQFYLFIKQGVDIQNQNPPADANMSKTLVRLWTNFIKYHNPTPAEDKSLPTWEKWTKENNLFYTIDQYSIKMVVDPKLENYKFWQTLPFRDKMQPFPFYPKNKTITRPPKTNSSSSHRWHLPHHSSSSAILPLSILISFFIFLLSNL